jgi:hypothetical protein
LPAGARSDEAAAVAPQGEHPVKKSLTLVSVAAALAVWSSPAAADPISHGTIALGAERLTGFYHSKDSIGPNDVTRNKISLLGEASNGPYDLPRIGIDGFIIDGLSLGGTLAIGHTAQTDKTAVAGGSTSTDSSGTAVLFAPRVGYGVMFSEHVGIWPRGGFSYFTASSDGSGTVSVGGVAINAGGTSVSRHYFSLNIDVPFLFKLAPNFAITAGPTIDVSLDGSQKVDLNGGGTATNDASYAAFGIAAGLVALL